MKISNMITRLQAIQNKHGDLPILGGYVNDDSGVTRAIVIDNEGCDVENNNTASVGVFFEA